MKCTSLLAFLLSILCGFTTIQCTSKMTKKNKPLQQELNTTELDTRTLKSREPFVGTWQWIYTDFVQRGGRRVETPESTGTQKRYVFEADGTCQIFENGKLVEESIYEIDERQQEARFPVEKFIYFLHKDSTKTGMPFWFNNDTLRLVGSYNDAAGDIYLKQLLPNK